MARSKRYLYRDLFELGFAGQSLIIWTDILWFYTDIDDPLPGRLAELVREIRSRLANLAKADLGDMVRNLAQQCQASLSEAWAAFKRCWQAAEHRRLLTDILRSDDGCAPPFFRKTHSPLISQEWTKFRQSFANLVAVFPEGPSLWGRFGSLCAQAINLPDREPPEFLGERFPFQALQDILRQIRDSAPIFSNVDVQLFDSNESDLGFFPSDEVEQKLKMIRKVLLDRLVQWEGGTSRLRPEIAIGQGDNEDTAGQSVSNALLPDARAASSSAQTGTKILVADTLTDALKVLDCESRQVKLYGQAENPLVKGRSKPRLSQAQYKVVRALIQAIPNGLTKDELDKRSTCGDARKTMKRLADSDPDWASVLMFPGRPGVGYGIR